MKLTLKRLYKKNDYTIGKLYIDGEYFCDTLEDKDRGLTSTMTKEQVKGIKVPAKTAIPTGVYKVILNMSPRFKKILPLLVNVLGYSGVRIHSGNIHQHTEGCILVGYNTAKGQVLKSKSTMTKLMAILQKQTSITITIQ